MKKFIVRDKWGYCISETDVELDESELKSLSGLTQEADLCYSNLNWNWESEIDWCGCGDVDCLARQSNGGRSCDDEN